MPFSVWLVVRGWFHHAHCTGSAPLGPHTCMALASAPHTHPAPYTAHTAHCTCPCTSPPPPWSSGTSTCPTPLPHVGYVQWTKRRYTTSHTCHTLRERHTTTIRCPTHTLQDGACHTSIINMAHSLSLASAQRVCTGPPICSAFPHTATYLPQHHPTTHTCDGAAHLHTFSYSPTFQLHSQPSHSHPMDQTE